MPNQTDNYQANDPTPSFEGNRHLAEDRYREEPTSADTSIYEEPMAFTGPATETNLHSPIHQPLPFLKGGIYAGDVSASPVYQKGSRLLLFMSIFIALGASLTILSLALNQFRSNQVLDIMGGAVNWGHPAIAIIVNLVPNLWALLSGIVGIVFWPKPQKAPLVKFFGVVLMILAGILALANGIGFLATRNPEIKAQFLNGFIVAVFRLLPAIFYTVGASVNMRLRLLIA